MQKRKIRIAIIDDSSLSIHLIQKMLYKVISETNVKVRKFSDGEQFILSSNYSNEHYDLIITDFNMPKKSGLEVIKHVRKIERAEKLKNKSYILMVSGNKSKDTQYSCLKEGADFYISKPYDPTFTENKIKEYLVEILRLQNRVLPKIKQVTEEKKGRGYEINIELLIHKLRVYLINYKEEFKIDNQTINEMFLFFNVLPRYIDEDEKFKAEFFGEEINVKIEEEMLINKYDLDNEIIPSKEKKEIALMERDISKIIKKKEELIEEKVEEEPMEKSIQREIMEEMKEKISNEIREEIMKELLQGLNKR